MTADRKLVGGVWLPAGETHLVEMMETKARREAILADGRLVLTYQMHKLDAALDLLPLHRRTLAVDVGAHVGLWTMHLAGLFDRVIAVEPVPLHQALLAANLGGPRLASRVDILPAAAGSAAGRLRLALDPASSGDTHAAEDGELDVPVVALDDQLADCGVDLIKIDTEGFELEVLQGARETLRRCRPLVVIEQKGKEAEHRGRPRDEARRWLEAELGAVALRRPWSGDWYYGWR